MKESLIAEAHLRFDQGVKLAKSGELRLAINKFTRAIQLKVDLVEAYLYRATAHVARGDHELAIKDYSKVIQLKPDYPETYDWRGLIYVDQGEHELAIKDYTGERCIGDVLPPAVE